MTHLSAGDRHLITLLRLAVPATAREEWARTWQAELWHLHHRRRRSSDLLVGILKDALWLRSEHIKRALRGTPTLCLLTLSALCLVAATIGLSTAGGLEHFAPQAALFAFEAPCIVFVTFATTSRRHLRQGPTSPSGGLPRLRRQLFFTLKAALILFLAFLLSADLAEPTHRALPFASDLVQTLLAVLFSIAGLRWAMLDQQDRCKQCLVVLTSPARIGRPGHNLLEWNGTAQQCRHGHGTLTSPELETSWCSHSQWQDQISV